MPGNMRVKSKPFLLIVSTTLLSGLLFTSFTGADASDKAWSSLLSKYVDDKGSVRYHAWKENADDLSALDAYLSSLADIPLDIASKDANIRALLINAYNAAVVKKMIEHYPVDAVQSIPRFFTDRAYELGGKKFTLNEIEDQIRNSGDLRVHAAMMRPAKSSPPLRQEAYEGVRLDEQLDDQMSRWLARSDLNAYDAGRHEISISKIFVWYKRDFGTSDEALFDVIKKYGAGLHLSSQNKSAPKLTFREFDWSLNDAQGDVPAPSESGA